MACNPDSVPWKRTRMPVPLSAPREKVSVPFGDSNVTVVVRPRQPLGGSLPGELPWWIALLGALLTLLS